MVEKNNIVVVTGISGSGKDYLLNKSKEKQSNIGKEIPVFSAGHEMMKRIQQKGEILNIQNRDELKRILTPELSKQIVREILNDILKYKTSILNGHIAYKQNGSIQINPDIDRQINARDYILITVDPELLISRRNLDISRNREVEDVIDINIHQDIAKSAVKSLSEHLGARFTILQNAVDNVAENTSKIIEIINN